MCEHCNGDCLEVEEILSLPELQRISREVDEEFETLTEAEIMQQIRGYDLVFFSHPFADDPINNRKRCDFLVKQYMQEHDNVIVISPLHIFSYIDKEDEATRKMIMQECYEYIGRCDKSVFNQYDGFMSKGQSDEILYAEECGKEIEVEEINQQMLDRKLGIVG